MLRSISVCLLLILTLAASAAAQDCDDPTPEQMMELQQKAMALMAAGPEHELLAGLAGDFTATAKMYMPGMDAMESSMTSHNEMILDGRFLRSVSQGSLMGMSVESVNIFGYDRRHEHYTMIGFDTMGTYYITASGQYDESTRTLTLHGTDDDPVLGLVQDYTIELIFDEQGGATFALTFNCPTMGTGAPFKLFEYTWVKAP